MEKNKRLMKAVYILLFISSFSILISLAADSSAFEADYEGDIFGIVSAYAVGGLFWGCLIAGYVCFCVINAHRKKEKSNGNSKKRIGAISFFSNKYARLFDILMIVDLILILIFELALKMDNGLIIFLISLFIFSFHMHCILNGANYDYINSGSSEKKELKKESDENGK